MEKRYYKVTDLENKPFTLIERGDTVQVAEHNSSAERVSFRPVAGFSIHDYVGKVDEISFDEYTQILSDWGYTADAHNTDAEVIVWEETVSGGESPTIAEADPAADVEDAAGGEQPGYGDPALAVDGGAEDASEAPTEEPEKSADGVAIEGSTGTNEEPPATA